ncbi:MAG: NF038122 family metalloprotease [Armatimonas sp.]
MKRLGGPYAIALGLSILGASAAHAQLNIVINPNATLSANPAALAAFNRAAAQWSSRITDNITITVDAGLASLGAGVIGSTGNVTLQAGYDTIRDAMVADKPGNALLSALPTSAQFTATLPSGGTLDGLMSLTKANAKALGFQDLDTNFGTSDGNITFSTNFNFDYDNSNGVTAGFMDFETVAAHEIGHLLGFVSIVDSVDAGTITNTSPMPLDLFRFDSTSAPTSLAAFTTTARDLRAGGTKVTSSANQNLFIGSGGSATANVGMSTGRFTGDGNQASHWKADDITGVNIGIMDPTLNFGQTTPVGFNDLIAMSLIGYNLAAVPEPSSVLLLLAPGMLLFLKRRR